MPDHGATRSTARRTLDTFAGFLRIDLLEERLFPFGTTMKYVAVVVPVLMYFFQAEFLDAEDKFAVTLIGVSVAAGLQTGLTGLTSRITVCQETGVLETFLVEPVSWRLLPIALNLWPTITGALISTTMLLTGALLGADLELARLPLFILVLALGLAACNVIGLLAASFLVLFKRGEPVIAVYGVAASFLGGSLFAISVLPSWIRWASYLIPHSYVISAERSIMASNPPSGTVSALTACIALVVFTLIAGLVAVRCFHRALSIARRAGLLSA
jgi:ABC-2 type transport system permease protein